MKNIKILLLIIFISLIFNKSIAADLYFVDIKQILNKSKAGKKAQDYLKKKFDEENEKLKKESISLKKEESDLDLPLPKGFSDLEYLTLLDEYLDPLIEEVKPDFIFYLSGVDILETDRLGTLGLTLNGCKERDHKVLNLAYSKGIPIQCSMGGGYSKDIRVIVEAHANLFRIAQYLYD